MKKAPALLALSLLGCLSLAACGPAVTTPPAPVATAPQPAQALRYSVTPETPLAVSVSPGEVVAVSRKAGVESVLIRWTDNPALTYLLSPQAPQYLFKAYAGLTGEYLDGQTWRVFLRIDRPPQP